MSMLEAALKYARHGWPVFPLKHRSKFPLKDFKWLEAATTDEQQIREWFSNNQGYNIAIKMGEQAGVFAVDTDNEEGEAWARTHLPPTLTSQTRKGYHRLYLWDGQRNKKLRYGVETRGEGGYIVAPPSIVAGWQYRWVNRTAPKPYPEEEEEDMRDGWAISAVDNNIAEMRKTQKGNRNQTLYTTAKRLLELEHRVPNRLGELEAAARATGLSQYEIDRTINSARNGGIQPDNRNLPGERKEQPDDTAMTHARALADLGVDLVSPRSNSDDFNQAVREAIKAVKGEVLTNGAAPAPQPEKHSDKVRAAFRDLGYTFYYNQLTEQTEYRKGDGQLKQLTDIEESALRADLNDLGLSRIRPVLDKEALENAYHPFFVWLDSLPPWDGEDHIKNLTDACLNTKPRILEYQGDSGKTIRKDFKEIVFKRFLTGAIRKMRDGDQNQVLVLHGPQGIGKSRLVRWLCSPVPTLFTEGTVNPNDKDCLLRLTSKFLWEIDELDATTRKADVSALKGFLTKSEVTARRAYGRHDVTRRATCSFIGTVNSPFLTDDTGNRRFWIVELESIMWGYEFIPLEQLWAQAKHYADEGFSHDLVEAEQQLRDGINREYMADQPLPGLIQRFFDCEGDDFISSSDILLHLQKEEVKIGMGVSETMLLSRAMAQLGIRKGKKGRINGYFGVKPGTGRGWD